MRASFFYCEHLAFCGSALENILKDSHKHTRIPRQIPLHILRDSNSPHYFRELTQALDNLQLGHSQSHQEIGGGGYFFKGIKKEQPARKQQCKSNPARGSIRNLVPSPRHTSSLATYAFPPACFSETSPPLPHSPTSVSACHSAQLFGQGLDLLLSLQPKKPTEIDFPSR